MFFKNKKVIVTILIILIISIFIVIRSCNKKSNIIYDYSEVSKGSVIKTISTNGTIELLNSDVVLSKVNGVILKLLADYNDTVTRGQLLAIIDAGELDNQFLKVAKQLEKAKLDLKSQAKDLEGKRNLYKDNLISENAMQLAELEYEKLLATVRQIEIDYNSLLQQKNNTRVVAPVSGIILAKDVNVGDLVSPGKRLFIIAENLRKMRIIINIDESDIGYVKKGQLVTFSVSAYPQKNFKGIVDQVRFNPINKGNVVTYEALVICDNPELLLKPGMTATAVVEVGKKENVLRVPNEALIVSPFDVTIPMNKKIIWKKKRTITDIPVEPVEVTVGLSGDSFTEITSNNLQVGQKILVNVRKNVKL